ncbi:MAG: hypothetical protein ABWZ64_07035, partial [Xanthobacteraceae bacterium]
RPLFAPRATDSVPSARASARLKRRTLAARLQALAERTIAEMEATPGIDLEKLAEAFMLMRMIKLAARPKRRRTGNARAIAGAQRTALDYEDAASVTARLRAAGIDPARAPEMAVKDFIESHAPPRDFPELRARGRTSRRVREHRRMLEPYRK